jgi:hypothetical protein
MTKRGREELYRFYWVLRGSAGFSEVRFYGVRFYGVRFYGVRFYGVRFYGILRGSTGF